MAKKLWIIFLCALLLISFSFACGKSKTEKKSKKNEKVSSKAGSTFMEKNAEEYHDIKAVVDMLVYAPEYLPSGLKIQRVIKIKSSNANPAYYEIDYSKGLTISGSSNKDYKTDAEFIGEFDLAGRHMAEHSYQSNPKSYQLLWRSDNGTYIVSINSSEGITRDEAKKIAESMKLVP